MSLKEFEPDRFERLRQSRNAKALMLARFRQAFNSQDAVSLERNIKSFHEQVALRWAALVLTVCGAVASGFGLEEEKHTSDPNKLQGPSSVSRNLANSRVEPFLKYPVPRDSNVQVVQGWIYKSYRDGQRHAAIDYIEGTDLTDSSTWSRRLTVMAPADGIACQYSFPALGFSRNWAIRIKHPNGYKTVILHMMRNSIKRRGEPLPSCNLGQDRWLQVIAGDALGLAGDSGTQPDWNHAHVATYDQFDRPVDPYDIRGKREKYPNTDGSNGKYCGPNALFFEEVCPREPQRVGDVILKNLNEIWEIPGKVSVKFDRVFVNTCPIYNCTYLQEQFASFFITNKSGIAIDTGYGFKTGFEMKVILADGRVIDDSELFYSPEPRVSSPDVILPRQTARVDLNFARTYKLAPESRKIHGIIYDTSGAVVVLIFDNQRAAWQLP